ncbi:MAG: molybdenum cofactor biosynthesis protein, partial [Deltaproteobacteria bacterium]
MNEVFTAGILTISDKASAGKRQDSSGKVAARMLEKEGFSVVKQMIVPDSIDRIRDTLLEWVDRERLALIVTSGGTG